MAKAPAAKKKAASKKVAVKKAATKKSGRPAKAAPKVAQAAVVQAPQKNAFEEKFGEGTAFNLDYGKLLIVALFVCTDTAKVLTGECEMNYSTAR